MKSLMVIGFTLIMFLGGVSAQNTKNYTPVNMYMLNPLLINPAYSGTKESLSANMMFGANWLDIPGAQLGKASAAGWMQSLSFDLPLSEKNAVGFIIRNNKTERNIQIGKIMRDNETIKGFGGRYRFRMAQRGDSGHGRRRRGQYHSPKGN